MSNNNPNDDLAEQAKGSSDEIEVCEIDETIFSNNNETNEKQETSIVVVPDFVPIQPAVPCKKKDTKFRSIYTKNMQVKLPSLKWLPGQIVYLRGNDNDKAIFDMFKESVNKFKIVSIMIFAEEEPQYNMAAITFSTPLLTVFFHIATMCAKTKNKLEIPQEILGVISRTDITIVIPGKYDWHYTLQTDHLERLIDKSTINLKFAVNPIELVDYRDMLHICNTGKGVCEHMKMIYWLFQFKIDSQLHGNTIPASPSGNWKNLIDHYGKLLIYEYWALNEKLYKYNQNPKNGVDTSPIYLEDLLIRYKIVNNMTQEELRKKLLGGRSYPNPPLPNLPG